MEPIRRAHLLLPLRRPRQYFVIKAGFPVLQAWEVSFSPLGALEKRLINDLGGCCPVGAVCGLEVCTLYDPVATTINSVSSDGQTGTVLSAVTSISTTNQIDPTITSLSSTQVSGTTTVSRIQTTTMLVTGAGSGGLTGAQIGGISAGVVVGFLLLVALGWLIVRHLIRISHFMDKFDNTRDKPDNPATKDGEPHTRGTELSALDSSNIGGGQTMTEMSPQERPQLLEEWGRHGSRGNELPGSYTAHGVSELDSSSVART